MQLNDYEIIGFSEINEYHELEGNNEKYEQ